MDVCETVINMFFPCISHDIWFDLFIYTRYVTNEAYTEDTSS